MAPTRGGSKTKYPMTFLIPAAGRLPEDRSALKDISVGKSKRRLGANLP